MNREYIYDLKCPRCGKTSQHTVVTEKPVPVPVVSCGDCLMNDMEMVEFKIVRVEVRI